MRGALILMIIAIPECEGQRGDPSGHGCRDRRPVCRQRAASDLARPVLDCSACARWLSKSGCAAGGRTNGRAPKRAEVSPGRADGAMAMSGRLWRGDGAAEEVATDAHRPLRGGVSAD